MSERVLIVDFGSQVTQLIARRVREAGVYSEVHPFNRVDAAFLAGFAPVAVILSGGPASVLSSSAPSAHPALFEAGAPVLGICYGQQVMAAQMGARVSGPPTTGSSGAQRWRRSRRARCSRASGSRAGATRYG